MYNVFDDSTFYVVYEYGTDLMQRRTRMQVLGYNSTSARTRSSVSFNGLELGLELERAARQTKNDNKGAYYYRL